MTKLPSLTLLLLPSLTLLSCGGPLREAPERDAAPAPILGHLKTRRELLTILSSPAGPRFTVRDERGQQRAEGLSLDELRARHRDLFDHLQRGYALDASVQTPEPEPQPYR